MAIFNADTLRTNNPDFTSGDAAGKGTGYPIVYANEIGGSRSVQTLADLDKIPDNVLSKSGDNTDNDAIGQVWYVIDEDESYQLKSWEPRKWEIFKDNVKHTEITSDYIDSYLESINPYGTVYEFSEFTIDPPNSQYYIFDTTEEAEQYLNDNYDMLMNYDYRSNPNEYSSYVSKSRFIKNNIIYLIQIEGSGNGIKYISPLGHGNISYEVSLGVRDLSPGGVGYVGSEVIATVVTNSYKANINDFEYREESLA